MSAEPILSDDPALLADLDASVKAINSTTDDIVAHLNAEHSYTIPPPPFQPSAFAIRALQKEHAAIHAQKIAQEHLQR